MYAPFTSTRVTMHEAAHAAACLALSVPIERITSRPDISSDGASRAGHIRFGPAAPQDELVIIAAAELAEARHLGRPVSPQSIEGDRRRSWELAKRIDPRNPSRAIAAARQKAAAILTRPGVWAALEMIAFDLSVVGTMSGAEAERIWATAMAQRCA